MYLEKLAFFYEIETEDKSSQENQGLRPRSFDLNLPSFNLVLTKGEFRVLNTVNRNSDPLELYTTNFQDYINNPIRFSRDIEKLRKQFGEYLEPILISRNRITIPVMDGIANEDLEYMIESGPVKRIMLSKVKGFYDNAQDIIENQGDFIMQINGKAEQTIRNFFSK